MAPKPFRKLLDSLPFANRSRSHHSGIRDAHDLTPAAAEAVSAVASNPTGVPALVPAEVPAGKESTSSRPEYHLDPEMARKYMANIKRFRILVMGRANAGKTTILQRVCNTTDNPEIFDGEGNKIKNAIVRGTLERGHHNIEHEHVFSSNPGFVFHDSCGFEAGSAGQFDEMKSFVVNRAVTGSLKKRIHAIWFCIPMTDYQRTVTAAERKFFNECDTGHVPVIVLLTKADALQLAAMEELLDDNIEVGEAKKQAAEKEKELLERWLAHIKGILEKCKFPPKAYVSVQKMHQEGANCTTLMECTTNAVKEEGLQRLLISTQQSSIALCVEYAVKRTLRAKMELGIEDRLQVNVKDLQRELLQWFPNEIDKSRRAWAARRAAEAEAEAARAAERDNDNWWWRNRDADWDAWAEAAADADWDYGDHLYELSSLAVVIHHGSIPDLPQNSTVLGKFPTLQSMVGHAIVCLLVFEHAYFLMQQGGHGWEEALMMAVNRCKSAHIWTTISTAVKAAFQWKGNNMADLCETICRIIGENKISM